jgi:hypothetical protein
MLPLGSRKPLPARRGAYFSSQGFLLRVLSQRFENPPQTEGHPMTSAMTSAMKWKATIATLIAAFAWQQSAFGEVVVVQTGGWRATTDGRVNTFISTDWGNGIPEGSPDYIGTVTRDRTHDVAGNIRGTRIRNGFLTSILAFELSNQVTENFKATARVGLWMNISSGRTKNNGGPVDPRELYGKLEGPWGSLLGGSHLSLFGRGGILVDYQIAHNYGLGYPCQIEDSSGGACGMSGFGALFPGYDPGFVYTTPNLHGFELAVGIYDPATVGLGQLNRAPWPRLEAEATYAFHDRLRVFASGFWQPLEGTITNPDPMKTAGPLIDISAVAKGVQAGLMVTVGPVMIGGAAFAGQGMSSMMALDENQSSFSPALGTPRKSYGGFGLAGVMFDSLHLKVAGGAGLFHLNKAPDDPEAVSATGTPGNPQLLKQNIGYTLGVYQSTGPVHFALEYFRAQHTLYDFGTVDAVDPTAIDVIHPRQVVNFINAGFTVVW